MSTNAQNHPSNIFVATHKNTGKIFQITVRHQKHNGRDCWTASSHGVCGIAQSNLSAAGAASQLSNLLHCEGLTAINLNLGATTPPVVKKEPTPEEEFDELLTKYAKSLSVMDPNAVTYARWQVVAFVKQLVQENQRLQSRVNKLEAMDDAQHENPWNDWR